MERRQQTKIINDLHERKMKIIKSKSSDYANDDVLSNFKGSAAVLGISAPRQILSLIATKVARLANLIDRPGTQNNESIEDSILDLSAYTDLLYCMMQESNADKLMGGYDYFDTDKTPLYEYKSKLAYVTEKSSEQVDHPAQHGQDISYDNNSPYNEPTWDSYSYSPL